MRSRVTRRDRRDEAAESWRCLCSVDLQGGLVHAGLDDLVIALYVTIDDLLGPDPRRGHPGRKPRLSDAELVCLAVAQVLLGCHDEHRWLRVCYGRLGHLFPHLPNQPGYNKRLRAARWLLDQVGAHLAGQTPASRTPSGCWTPPRSPARPAVRRSSGRRWVGGPITAGVPATRAGTGASSCMSSPRPTAARLPGAWPAPSWASGRSPRRCWTATASILGRSSSSTRA